MKTSHRIWLSIMVLVTLISLSLFVTAATRVGAVENRLAHESAVDRAAVRGEFMVNHPQLHDDGFTLSPTLKWEDQGDGILAAQTPRGGLCLKVDRNGSDGVFCSGEVKDADATGNASDGAVVFNWLAKAKGLSVAKQESRADKYRAIQRDLTEGIQSVERMQRNAQKLSQQ